MPKEVSPDSQARAVALVQTIADQNGSTLSNAQLATVIQAVAQDFQDAADKTSTGENRLTELE